MIRGPRSKLSWAGPVRVLLCPPLFFAQRKRWTAFVINGFFYALCLSVIVGRLYDLVVGGEGSAPDFETAALFWLICLAHVAATWMAERVAALAPSAGRPSSARRRFLEGIIIVGVGATMTLGLLANPQREPMGA